MDHVGVSLVSSRTLLFMRPSACARARAREREKSDGSKIALEQKEKMIERDR